MKKVVLELKEGDHIVHATHGVGEIMGIESKKLQDEKHVYYTVKTDKLTYWLELVESNSARIRSVCSPATFTKALAEMRREPKPLSNNFRVRIRSMKDEMAKCSVMANARLIRDLHARNAEKNLHVNEHRTMDKLKNQFASEWAVSADIDKKKAFAEMEKALSESIEKLIAQENTK